MNGMASRELPDELVALLPADPFEQLDIAWRIAQRAYNARIAHMESETGQGSARALEGRVAELEQALQDSSRKLSHALDEQAKLSGERNALVATVKKLNRDVAKLETFKRTLMQQLQDEPEEEGAGRGQQTSASGDPLLRVRLRGLGPDSYGSPPRVKTVGGAVGESSDAESARGSEDDTIGGGSVSQIGGRVGRSTSVGMDGSDAHSLPPVTGFTRSTSVPPENPGISGAPSDHSTIEGLRTLRTRTPGRTPVMTPHFSPHLTPSAISPFGSAAGSPKSRPNRVDGKEFFRQARNRLSHEQFSEFLANIKELNAHRQSREVSHTSPRLGRMEVNDVDIWKSERRRKLWKEMFQPTKATLRKAEEIFGPENRDLCLAFDGLLSRHLPT